MTIYKKFYQLLTHEEHQKLPFLLLMVFLGMALEMLSVGLVVPVIAVMTKPSVVHQFISAHPVLTLFVHWTSIQLIVGSMLGLVGLYFFKTIFLMMMLWKQNKFINDVYTGLASRLFTAYLKQSWSFHLQRNSAQLIHNVNSEVGVFICSTLQPGLMVLTEGVVLLGVIALLLKVEFLGSLVVVGVVGAVGYGFQLTTKNYIQNLGTMRQRSDGARMQHLHQGLGGVKDVKLLGREAEFISQYDMANRVCIAIAQKQKMLADLPRLWLELLAVIALVTLVLVMLVQGKSLDSLLPTLGLFAAAAFRLLPSVNRLLGAMQSFRFSIPVINLLHNDFQNFNELPLQPSSKNLLPFKNALVVDHVDYQYDSAHTLALNNISLRISVGASVGLVGPSGGGKSTLVDIILGLLPPTQGHVKVDGFDIQTNLRGWQDQIGYVPQSIYLTDDTLRRNVAFGLSDDMIDEVAVTKAIRLAQLDDFVKSLPDGVNTVVGERGVRLSGGQRQRIGIARALYHDPAVLVLDEATSALDTATEQGVMEAINALHGTKTLIIVAHRLSTVAQCDRLYRIEQGKIVAEGSFEQVTNIQQALA